MLSISCEKNVSERLPEEQTNWREWTYPAVNLPKNLGEILINPPCWEAKIYLGRIVDGKLVIESDEDLAVSDGGPTGFLFKFGTNEYEAYYAVFNTYKPSASIEDSWSCGYAKDKLSRIRFIGCKENEVAFIFNDSQSNIGEKYQVYMLTHGTQEQLDKMIAKLHE